LGNPQSCAHSAGGRLRFAHLPDHFGPGERIDDIDQPERLRREVLAEIVRISQGKMTKAEIHEFGYSEVLVKRMCGYV
jgi:hypothetical protein